MNLKQWEYRLSEYVERWRYRRTWRKRLRVLDKRGLLQSGRVVSSTPTSSSDERAGPQSRQSIRVVGKVLIRELKSPGQFLIAGPVAIDPNHQLPAERVVPVTAAFLIGEQLTLRINLNPQLQEDHDTRGVSYGQIFTGIDWNAGPPIPANDTE